MVPSRTPRTRPVPFQGTCTRWAGVLAWEPPQKSLDFRLGPGMARVTQSQLSSGLSTAGEQDGPSAFPGGHFLLLDPNPYWASTLCLSRSRHRVLQETKGGERPQRQKTLVPVLENLHSFADIMAGYGPAATVFMITV